MGDRQPSETKAAHLLAAFLNKHLPRGTGNNNVAQTAAAFAAKSGLTASRISNYRKRIGGLPQLGSLDTLENTFFPDRGTRANDPAFREWQEIRHAILGEGLPAEPGPDEKSLSLREAWELATRPINRNTLSIVRSAPRSDGAGALHGDQISGRLTEASFILPTPSWFIDELDADPFLRDRYDVHPPIDLSGASDLAHFYDTVPVRNLRSIVAYHTDAYAHFVVEALRRRAAYGDVWMKTKAAAGKVGGASVTFVWELAKAEIKAKLGLS